MLTRSSVDKHTFDHETPIQSHLLLLPRRVPRMIQALFLLPRNLMREPLPLQLVRLTIGLHLLRAHPSQSLLVLLPVAGAGAVRIQLRRLLLLQARLRRGRRPRGVPLAQLQAQEHQRRDEGEAQGDADAEAYG